MGLLVLILIAAFFAITGNGVFNQVYLWWSGFQLLIIVCIVFFLPFYVRYIIDIGVGAYSQQTAKAKSSKKNKSKIQN